MKHKDRQPKKRLPRKVKAAAHAISDFEAAEQLRTTLESIGDGFMACDADWRIVYFNAEAERLLKIRREQVLGRDHWEVFPGARGTKVEREYRRARAGEVRDFEIFYLGRWFRLRCYPRKGGGLIVYFHDITKWKKIGKALHESEEKFRAMFDTVKDGLFLVDPEKLRPVMANPACLRMLGYTLREFKALRIPDLHLKEDLPEVRREISKIGEFRFGVRTDLRFKRKDGTVFLADLSTSRLDLNGGRFILVSIRDITERERLRAEVERSHQELRALLVRLEQAREEERIRIARDIHDDFGQNLTALKMDLHQIGRIAEKEALSPPMADILERVVDALEITNSSLNLVHELASQLRPGILDRLGLGPALQFEARRFQERHGLECAVALSAALPDIPPHVATALFRTFQECLTNVLRHAKAGKVTAGLGTKDGEVCLTVRDNGVGIPDAVLASPDSLGLIGMRERAGSLGGRAAFQRGKTGGTVVEVRIPVTAPKDRRAGKAGDED